MSRGIRTAIVALLGFSMASAHGNEARIWTTKSGSTAEASFVKEEKGIVTLKKPDGSMVQVPRRILSPADEAYLVRVLYVPKTVTVSFAPTSYQGRVLFMEVGDTDKQQMSRLSRLRRRTADAAEPPEIQHADTLCFRFKSEITGEWGDDSTWNVLSAHDIGQTLAGNAEWSGEKRKTDGRFVRVVFKMTNNTKDEKYVNVPELIDSKQRKVRILDDSGRFIDADYADPHLDKLPPGFSRTYCAIYEVPKDATGLNLVVPTLASYQYSNDGPFLPVGDKPVVLDLAEAK
jgi:hypothetical protein